MGEFEKFIVMKYPNRSAKVLLQKLEDTDGTLFYGIKEVQDQFEAWNHQQSKIEYLTEMNKRYLGKMQEQQDQIAELNEQLQAMRNAWEFVEGCRKEWHESYMRVREQIDQRISNGASITQHRIDL